MLFFISMQELNVKTLTTTTDKENYGARLHAEPDHKVLGSKLKGDFKKVIKLSFLLYSCFLAILFL